MVVYKGRQYYTTAEAAEELGLDRTQVGYAVTRGRMKGIKVPRGLVDGARYSGPKTLVLIYPESVEAYRSEKQRNDDLFASYRIPDEDLPDDQWVWYKDAAKMCNVSATTFHRALRRGLFGEVKKEGIRLYVTVGGVRDYMKGWKDSGRLRNMQNTKDEISTRTAGRVIAVRSETGNSGLTTGEEDPVTSFANAIIHLACSDLTTAYIEGDVVLESDCETFFRSQWFEALSPGLDGEVLIRMIRERVGGVRCTA